MMSTGILRYTDYLVNAAMEGDMKYRLAATLYNGKPVGKPCVNTQRNYCRRHICPSLHAEAKSILDHFGKELTYSEKLGWILSPNQRNTKVA
uniref:Uncharacterized protein n=1 Tax=viral metagenome TaxID=1070528 RepID=A0A6C0J4I7_9ZZZZ